MEADLVIPRLKHIKLLVLDCDGVLTNGQIILNGDAAPLISMSVRDGLGIKMLQRAGVRVAVISGRYSLALAHRAEVLGLLACITNRLDKGVALEELCTQYAYNLNEVAYMGDDIPDLAAFTKAHVALAPADAIDEIRAAADYVTTKPGGFGAVREVTDLILKAQGKWAEITTILSQVHTHAGEDEPR